MKGLKPKHSKPWPRNASLTPCIEVLTNLTFVDSLRTLERMSFQRSMNGKVIVSALLVLGEGGYVIKVTLDHLTGTIDT
jgi:hypothetical protein